MGDGPSFVGGSDDEKVPLFETSRSLLGSDPKSQRGWLELPTKTKKMKRKRKVDDD